MSDDSPVQKKPKMSADPKPTVRRCAHWVHRKKRHCKMHPSKGSLYCGTHAPATGEAREDSSTERIPCPLDPKHTVVKSKLSKHLTICNARVQTESIPYIVKDINAGEDDSSQDEQDESLKLHELQDDEFYGIIAKVKQLYEADIADNIEELHLQHAALEEPLSQMVYGPEARKHLLQTSALLGILEHHGQLKNNSSYIEFGAGKGQLAFYLATLLQQHLRNSQVVLIDRLSLRHKKDNKLCNKELVQRVKADIADLKLSQLPQLQQNQQNQRYVGLSKHLCGAATDLTLRCLLDDMPGNTDYILIALCCHHRCSWRSYVGKEWLQAAGISSREFLIITKMVSWAVCGSGLSRERRRAMEEAEAAAPAAAGDPVVATEPTQRLTREERESIGYQCKRVLDYGRVEHLRAQGYEASLKFYVSKEVTLENVVLMAQRDNSKCNKNKK